MAGTKVTENNMATSTPTDEKTPKERKGSISETSKERNPMVVVNEVMTTGDHISPMVTRMIAIGERSGSLEALLEKISEFYENEVSATVDALTSLIEPLMIGIMGVMVGGIVLAVFLPIFKMSSQMGK